MEQSVIMWKHSTDLPEGVRGEISKVDEEVAEYKDAKGWLWKVIELSDIVQAAAIVGWKQHMVPSIILVILALARIPYKAVRNLILDYLKLGKAKL